jgi:hypothetical protein
MATHAEAKHGCLPARKAIDSAFNCDTYAPAGSKRHSCDDDGPAAELSRSPLLLLRRRCLRHRTNANADLHRGVFGKDDVAAARDEVDVHRAACAKRTHGYAEGIRTRRDSHRDAHEIIAPNLESKAIL